MLENPDSNGYVRKSLLGSLQSWCHTDNRTLVEIWIRWECRHLEILLFLISFFIVVSWILESLLARILDARARLKNIDDILNNKIESNTFDNTKITNNYGKLGLIIGADYLGFKFVIKEESNTTVKGIKRRYAVAVNKDGNEVVKSQASFTLDPDVLIEELKLIIDQRNLQA